MRKNPINLNYSIAIQSSLMLLTEANSIAFVYDGRTSLNSFQIQSVIKFSSSN